MQGMAAIFITLAFLLLLSDAYIVFGVMGEMSQLWKILLLVPTAFYCVVIVKLFLFGDWRQSILNLLFWSTLCVVFPSLIFAILSLSGKGIGIVWSHAGIIFNVLGLLSAAIFLYISLYGIIIGWKKVTVEHVTVSSPDIPKAFDAMIRPT